nr:ribonuclease H-like domain-containing protein [Tanacetum cinerariifolium]
MGFSVGTFRVCFGCHKDGGGRLRAVSNLDARAITLDGELRSIKLGSLNINAYCTKIKAMADRLANLGDKLVPHHPYGNQNGHKRTSGLAISSFYVIVLEISIPSPNRQHSLLLSFPQAPPRDTNALVIPMINCYGLLLLVNLFRKSLYGLKQAPRAWFQRFAGYVTRVGFYHSRCDSSLIILRQGSQKQYAIELLSHAHVTNCNSSRTPVDTDSKLGPEGVPVQDPTLYRSLARGLQYLTFTRPDISYAVQQICIYMHDPRESHLAALKLQHQRTKHIEIDIHFIRDLVTVGQVRVLHVPSRYQYADIFTKGLPSALFEDFRSSLSVRLPSAPTAEEY